MFFEVVASPAAMNNALFADVILLEDMWDDFGFKTMYSLFTVAEGSKKLVGKVKIASRGLQEGRVALPRRFSELSNEYFSLGQDDEYYLELSRLPDGKGYEIAKALGDLTLREPEYPALRREPALQTSLLRHIVAESVFGQYQRLLKEGDASRRVPYTCTFERPTHPEALERPEPLTFTIDPATYPPSNLHILIGRNGAGKSTLLHQIASSMAGYGDLESVGQMTVDQDRTASSIILVSFSLFDSFMDIIADTPKEDKGRPHYYVGAFAAGGNDTAEGGGIGFPGPEAIMESSQQLGRRFARSASLVCSIPSKKTRWLEALDGLRYDPFFANSGVAEVLKELSNSPQNWWLEDRLASTFQRLSSGHAIVVLTLTRLVELAQEKTLVLFDEPEAHLHPPLMGAFVRCVTQLLRDVNGFGIAATHSPVVLQEVPKSCVWVLTRSGFEVGANRLEEETFGENLSTLTRDVFGLEVMQTSFYELISRAVDESKHFEDVLNQFSCDLGSEALLLARSLWRQKITQ